MFRKPEHVTYPKPNSQQRRYQKADKSRLIPTGCEVLSLHSQGITSAEGGVVRSRIYIQSDKTKYRTTEGLRRAPRLK